MNPVLPMAVMLTLLGGCAATYHELPAPANHPANPAAEIAPAVEASHTLAIAPTRLAPPKAATPAMAGEHGGDNPPTATTGAALYVCPMHPEVISEKPDQRCPKCGMKLVKKEGGKQP